MEFMFQYGKQLTLNSRRYKNSSRIELRQSNWQLFWKLKNVIAMVWHQILNLMMIVKLNRHYVVVIVWCRVQYGKYFPSFSYFVTYFTSLWASEIIAKYEKRGKYLPILHEATCDNYFIVKCLLKSNKARVILLIKFLLNII